MSNYYLVLDKWSESTLGWTASYEGARTGVNVITIVGAIAGCHVTAVVGVAANWDALLHIAAGGALVYPTKNTE